MRLVGVWIKHLQGQLELSLFLAHIAGRVAGSSRQGAEEGRLGVTEQSKGDA